ncbi:MAG: cell division protein FtsQ/DivIB, partial [Aristaeellaceae bacterium]
VARQNSGPVQPPYQPVARQNSGPVQPPVPPYGQPGPYPLDPFDEPSNAPELRQQRSDNLYNKERTFWHTVGELQNGAATAPVAPVSRQDGHALRWMVLILAVVVAAGFLVCGTVFRVREISVQGNSTISDEEVIRLSGIREGMNTLALDHDTAEQGVESNRYLSFVCLDVQLPDKLVIQVRERTPAAVIEHCGILYTADNRGMVLEESLDTEQAHPGLVAVEGMGIYTCEVGKQLVLKKSAQLEVYATVLLELKVMSATEQILELDMNDMDNLFLVTVDGYSVRLGNSDSLHAKLRAMLMTLEWLREQEQYQGTLDVSSPVNPTYIPNEL